MKILLLGAAGVVGQHLLLNVPEGIEVLAVRKSKGPEPFVSVDLSKKAQLTKLLNKEKPDVIVNLAGENRVDVVESDPKLSSAINVKLPENLADWCDENSAHLIQCSTQGIFSGDDAPYDPTCKPVPRTKYGEQKLAGELAVRASNNWTIARLTFVLGVRPLRLGRWNPVEDMMTSDKQKQVNDRFFSPLFAHDAAKTLWELVLERPQQVVYHLGTPVTTSRFNVAQYVTAFRDTETDLEPVSHEFFPGIAQRPADTTWTEGALYGVDLGLGLQQCIKDWKDRENMTFEQRAKEIAIFLGKPYHKVFDRLQEGFHYNHAEVAKDFYESNPQTDKELTDWYRKTEAYIYELSVYHGMDEHYDNLIKGVSTHLKALNKKQVLILGDGIGDLSIGLKKAGLNPTYNDLQGSRTAEFAKYKFAANNLDIPLSLTNSWEPVFNKDHYDAVLAYDYFEHIPDNKVEQWANAVYDALKSDGIFQTQNAFGIGLHNMEDGRSSIPMHEASESWTNERWALLLEELGFVDLKNGWHQKL